MKAFVVLEQGVSSAKRNPARVPERLESFMVPKYVEFVAELPKTTTGKIKKTDLR